MSAKQEINDADTRATISRYVSPRQLAERWNCSRTAAQRIADRAGIAKYYLGEGRNGMVRYAVADIEAYECSRRVEICGRRV